MLKCKERHSKRYRLLTICLRSIQLIMLHAQLSSGSANDTRTHSFIYQMNQMKRNDDGDDNRKKRITCTSQCVCAYIMLCVRFSQFSSKCKNLLISFYSPFLWNCECKFTEEKESLFVCTFLLHGCWLCVCECE